MTKERKPIFEVQCWKMCWIIPSKALLLTNKSIFPLSTILQTLQAIKTFTAHISLLKLFLCLELLTLELKKKHRCSKNKCGNSNKKSSVTVNSTKTY